MKALKIVIKRHLLNRRLKTFEKDLEGKPVPSEKVESLFNRLSIISKDYKALGQSYPFTLPDVSDNLDHIVSLYGKIIALNQEHEVTAINHRAKEIDRQMQNGDHETLACSIDALRHHIATFYQDNRPSKRWRRIIAQAKESADRAEALLQQKEWKPQQSSLVLDVDKELAENLFEIGYLYFSGKNREATIEFNLLPEEVKKLFYQHLIELEGNPFDLNVDPIKWMQALIATGFDISRSPTSCYLKKDEMEAFFEERRMLDA